MKCNEHICHRNTADTPKRRITLEIVMAGIALLAALLLPALQHIVKQEDAAEKETRIAACGTVFSEYLD